MLDLFLQPLKQVLQEISNSPRATAVLCVIGAIYLLFRANAFLSKWTLNNYTVDRTWDWKREVVVVTGGSSGIGASTVELLASRGIKVLILDMVEPRKKLGKWFNSDTHPLSPLPAPRPRPTNVQQAQMSSSTRLTSPTPTESSLSR